MQTENPKDLLEALQQFEACLETPCVPGELEQWTQTVQRSFNEVEHRLRRQIEDVHTAQFSEIGQVDPGLLARVEHLQAHDRAILDRLENLEQMLNELLRQAPSFGPDEAPLRDELTTFVNKGLWFVIQARKQENAISTWLLEAFDRDRGTVD